MNLDEPAQKPAAVLKEDGESQMKKRKTDGSSKKPKKAKTAA